MNQKKKYLVLLDADRIKEYVFSTNKLKEIRGASAILDNLNLVETKKIASKYKAAVIYVGGGTGKFWFTDKSEAEEFTTAIEKIYQKETHTASITSWIEERKEHDNFKDVLDRAEKQIRRKKESKKYSMQLCSNEYFKYCELCGIYPATKLHKLPYESKWLCLSCLAKNKASGKKIEIYKRLERKLKEKNGIHLTLENYPDDFHEIGDSYGSKGYLGFIYADGNGMGKILQTILNNDPDNDTKLYDFSNAVDTATKDGIIESLLKNIPELALIEREKRKKKEIFPVEFIIAGGDDLVIAVPATKALQIVLDFSDNFEHIYSEMFKPKDSQGATISCGVVIAKSTYPINLFFKLSEDLLKSAKKLSKKPLLTDKNATVSSAIDFSVVTTSATGSLQEIRKSELTIDDALYLTEKPYKPEKLRELINFIMQCKEKGFPNSKLKVLYGSLFKGKNQATLDYLKLISRLKNEQKDIFINKFHEFTMVPWREKNGEIQALTTPFLDFVEVYDFITI